MLGKVTRVIGQKIRLTVSERPQYLESLCDWVVELRSELQRTRLIHDGYPDWEGGW